MRMVKILFGAVLLLVMCGGVMVKAQLSQQDQALFSAVDNHDVQQVEDALKLGANVNAQRTNKMWTSETETPLMVAAQNADVNVLQALIEHHANTEATNNMNETALTLAAMNGNANAVKVLLDAHANIDARGFGACHLENADYKQTALMDAVCNGHADVVKILLDHGASATATDKHGRNALFMALSGETEARSEIVQLLLARYGPETAVPEEARQSYVQANVIYRNAQSDDDIKSAIALYYDALKKAPWFGDAWNNLSLAQEKLGDYAGAVSSMKALLPLEAGGPNERRDLDRTYTLQAEQKMNDTRQAQQAQLNSAADSLRRDVGGYTMYKFFLMLKQDGSNCGTYEATSGSCYIYASDQYGYAGHDGSPIGAQAVVTTESGQVVVSLGTQRFCIPVDQVNTATSGLGHPWNSPLVHGITDCTGPAGAVYDFNVYLGATNPNRSGGAPQPLPGTVTMGVTKCLDPECRRADMVMYWLKP